MAKRFIIVPENTFSDVSSWEPVTLVQDELPASLYLDFDAADAASLTKDGSNYVTEWRNALGTEALDTAASGSNWPSWVDEQINGLPVIDCNNGGVFSIYSSANILHDLAIGYSWAAVLECTVNAAVVFATSNSTSNSVSAFTASSTQKARNANNETLQVKNALLSAGFHRLIGTYHASGDGYDYWLDGTKEGGFTSSGDPLTPRKLSLGWNSVFSGHIRYARFMFFSASLTDVQSASVDRILASTYAL